MNRFCEKISKTPGYLQFCDNYSFVIPKNSQWLQLSFQNYLMFNAFEEEYLCLLKMFLFSSIRRLYFIQFLSEIYMEKVLQELFGVPFLGHPYRSNGTKIHLDMTLFPEFSLIFFQKFTFSLSFLNFPEIFHKSLPGFPGFSRFV